MYFSCRSFIGRSSLTSWSQYWENEPDNPSLSQSKGHLFGFIHLHSSINNPDLSDLGRQLIDSITTAYFSSTHPSHLANLKELLSQLSPPGQDIGLDVGLIVVQGHLVYLANLNQVDILLRRGPQISHLLSASDSISPVSGHLEDNDSFLISTNSFFNDFGLEFINHHLANQNLETIEEAILSRLYSDPDQSTSSAALIRVHFDENDYNTPPPAPSNPPSVTISPPPTPPRPKSFFSSFFAKLTRSRPHFVQSFSDHQLVRRRRLRTIYAALLLLALALSSYFGYRKNQQSQLQQNYQNLKSAMEQKITDSLAVKNLNLDNSLELATQARDILHQIQALNVPNANLDQYSSQIESILSQTGSTTNNQLQSLYDTSIITPQPKFSSIFLVDTSLYLLDSTNGRLDIIDVLAKSTKNISQAPDLINALGLAVNQKNVYVLHSHGLFLVNQNSLIPVIDFAKFDPPITPTDLAFWNGSLYLLDSSNSSLWKFAPNSDGFSSPTSWLKSASTYPPNSTSLAINGNIWVLSKTGKISSFLLGQPQDFTTSSVYQATTAKSLVTNPDGQLLAYIANDNFVYLYQKSGEVQARYNLGDKKAIDIALNSDSTILYLLLSDQKIYQINL